MKLTEESAKALKLGQAMMGSSEGVSRAIATTSKGKSPRSWSSPSPALDATPTGQLMHGILASFNEFRWREDGADIAYKMGQKAKNGGTLGKAPVGYLNVTENIEGRKVNPVKVDPVRAPLVRRAFELYAAGDITRDEIVDRLTVAGLTTAATARRPESPISVSKMSRLLRDRYYLGLVVYKGEVYDGRHEPIIEQEVFDAVQNRLQTTGKAGERKRVHDSYLKGSLWCGECHAEGRGGDSRMIIQLSHGRNGDEYVYFFCRNRQEGTCTSRHLPMADVWDAVIDHYRTVRLTPAFIDYVNDELDSALRDQASTQQLRDQLTSQLERSPPRPRTSSNSSPRETSPQAWPDPASANSRPNERVLSRSSPP